MCALFRKADLPSDDLPARLDARFRGPLMSYFVRRVRSREVAEDLTQEVFVRVLRAAERGPIGDAEGLVFVAAANLLKNYERDGRRRRTVALDEDVRTDIPSDLIEDRHPERVLLGKEKVCALLAVLNELGPRTRDIYILFRWEGLKQRDIAERFGISRSMVEKEVVKAITHLTTRLGADQP